MLIQRILFFISITLLTLAACAAGIFGAEAVAIKLFGSAITTGPYSIFSLNLWLFIFSFCIGVFISGFGIIAAVIMPLVFLCPNARKPFTLQSKPPRFLILLFKWYAEKLLEYSDELDKNA